MPTPLAVLSWVLGGGFLLLAAGFGVYSLEDGNEGFGPAAAAIAGGLLLLASYLVVGAIPSLRHSPAGQPRSATRSTLGAVALIGMLVVAYVFLAAAPGGPAELDSWAGLLAAAVGLWLAQTALARLDERLFWRAAGTVFAALLLASVAVEI